ncbi:alkaline phosphatase family protein [Dactylosporangium siamense]|uniref:Acid phosphatase n=1 Tax=Dactylosporangium siamense TaxID=685454 RepID=A0A919UBF5_9ACTN|nr:acid phosphatase [Dactylosporangium siamense]
MLSVIAVCAALVGAGAVRADTTGDPGPPDHVVIVVMENKRYDAVVGHRKTPYITSLAARGANFTAAYGETHPSQPNYLALFSGSTQGVTDNHCGHTFTGVPNLARQLLDAGHTFAGYSEDLPSVGWTGCADRTYVRRHNPWVNFDNVPASANRPLHDFPSDYRQLPTVSFVIPGLCHDMHDCPKAEADTWLHDTFDRYIGWAERHNSLLVLTFDEDNRTDGNHIPTVVLGQHVTAGDRTERVDHYSMLRTIQEFYGLPPLGDAALRAPLALR